MITTTGLTRIYGKGENAVTAINNLDIRIDDGELVAITGKSGSGKTTLLNILAALDKPTSGAVRLSGGDITKIKDSKMSQFRREHLGFVFQDFNLLDTFSLRDNIFLPLVLSHKGHAEMAARLAPIARQLGIEALLDKYPYEVSGGQKQRLCIARALLKKPKILILDDSTSAVDTKTDAGIRRALREFMPETTKIIIAQRTASVEDADRIVVMDGGSIMAVGSHAELMASNEVYREIYTSQNKAGADE